MSNSEIEFYGPIIVGNCLESQKNPIIFQSRPKLIPAKPCDFGIDSYRKNNIYSSNNIKTFGDIVFKPQSHKLKYYKKFLYSNKNNYHKLSDDHLNNLVKLLNRFEILDKDIPKSFKIIKRNKPFYPSNNYN